MRLLPAQWPATANLSLLLATSLFLTIANALTFEQAQSANLDLSNLGSVALAGDFDRLSLYQYVGQQQSSMSQNGSHFVLGRYPSGGFVNIDMADAQIASMCTFYAQGRLAGVVTGGNFTSLGGQQSTGAALLNPSNGQISPLSGLNGQVRALYCDNTTSTVYVGGMFSALNSTNAIAWTTGWTNLPISGFNGPINAIEKLPNGHIIFGGQFTGVGQTITPRQPDAQIVNVGSANISAGPNATLAAYQDPRNIICKTSAQSGPGNAWITAPNGGGYWRADFGFGFNPSKLRLYQSTVPNYQTRTFRFTAFPINGIMNLTYTDPVDGTEKHCDNDCPMPENNSTYQDFRFVNNVGMNSFIIDVKSIYGIGGGFDGIELFQNDIYSYAVNAFNEPPCDDVSRVGSRSTTTGNWTQQPAGQSNSGYLSATIPSGTVNVTNNLSVVFFPDIRQAGNYSVTLYTPGCLGDGSCNARGVVNVTGTMATTPSSSLILPTPVYQTNDYDKYDTIFSGYVDNVTDTFRPSITLTPALNQEAGASGLTVVAQRVRFELLSSSGGLNGLYDFDPNANTITTDYTNNVIDSAGVQMREDAIVAALKQMGDSTFVGGRFSGGSGKALNNIYVIENGNASAVSNGGLNDAVNTFYGDDTTLYIGGNFTNTFDNNTAGLNNVASYNPGQRTWAALGAGVNGVVSRIVPVNVNLTGSSTSTPCIAISGTFSEINAFGQNQSAPVADIALWVPSRNNWLVNLPGGNLALSGVLSAYSVVPGQDTVYAGNVDSATLSATGNAGLQSGNSGLSLDQLPINLMPSQGTTAASVSGMQKRDAPQGSVSGVYTGLYYNYNNVQAQIFGGHFTARVTNGSTANNLAVIYSSDGNYTTGITTNMSSSAVVTALETRQNMLFAGGNIPNGMIMFNMTSRDIATPQAPAVNGGSVYAIAARPSGNDVYVGGSFTAAGMLQCLGICVWDTNLLQWRTLRGAAVGADSVINKLSWTSNDRLIMAGNFTIDGQYATLATYDAKAEAFYTFLGSNDTSNVPGPITTFSAIDSSYTSFFLGGVSRSNNSAFITRYDPNDSKHDESGGIWRSILNTPDQLGPTSQIEGLQVMPLSKSHASTPLIGDSQGLLITGPLNLKNYGNVSAALFNGTDFEPFVLSTRSDGSAGSIRRLYVQNPSNLLNNNNHHLALGYIVLIGLAIALALVFLIILIGFFAERMRRRREGYVPAPSYNYGEKGRSNTPLGANIGGISPERLFGGVRTGSPARL